MELQKRNRYSKEYKEDVVNMIKTGDKSVIELSKDLEISSGLLYRWYKHYNGPENKKEKEITEKDKELRSYEKKK